MARRALLIINGKSRSGKEAIPKVIQGLRTLGIDPEHKECSSRQELPALINNEGPNVDLIVIGGGDGTLNAAASALADLRKPLGIVPLGTANDLARTLGIPTDLDAALQVIAGQKARAIDVGVVNDTMFFNVASLGMSADLAQSLTGELKASFGKVGYALAAIRVLLRARPFRAEISSGKHRIRSLTLQIAVGNGRHYGGGNVIEESASIVDETLDLYSLEFLNAWRVLLRFRLFRNGEHGALEEVLKLRGSRFTVTTRRPRPINADGEIVTYTPALFRVLPKAINILVP
jgi:YegS/Rv2252/BmrU family lipid kinase